MKVGWEMVMKFIFNLNSGKTSQSKSVIFGICLLAGAFFALAFSPVYATPAQASHLESELTCTPPNDWAQTTRLKNPEKPTRQWSFNVDEPQMRVSLVFFYYQDYSIEGCPYDCSTGDCQTDETGNGESPLGAFKVSDGKEGANRGVKKMDGILPEGDYNITFTANGHPGSLNVGLVISQESIPTATPLPTDTPSPTVKVPTATSTPTATITSSPPDEDPTPPTKQPTKKPPATLAPPTAFPGSPPPQALIPETGVMDGVAPQVRIWVIIPLGIGIFGLGIAFYGISTRLKKEE
jgi:hypothetical protein